MLLYKRKIDIYITVHLIYTASRQGAQEEGTLSPEIRQILALAPLSLQRMRRYSPWFFLQEMERPSLCPKKASSPENGTTLQSPPTIHSQLCCVWDGCMSAG